MTIFFTENPYFRKDKFLHDTFFTQFVLSHASDNTTSRNIGRGTDALTVPHLKSYGGTVPLVPLSLRP